MNIYGGLAEAFGWGPDVVKRLTIDQQIAYMRWADQRRKATNVDTRTGRPTMRFKSIAEAEAYRRMTDARA